MLSLAVTSGIGFKEGMQGKKIDFVDVRRAYFHAKARREVYLKLPPEDNTEGKCGIFRKAMYGTRDAAQNCEHEYIEFMDGNGFHKSRASPCMSYLRERDVRVVIHGDDFTILGSEVELDWFRDRIVEKFEVRSRARLGPEDNDDKAVRLLNRVIEWTPEGIRYESDQRHTELIMRDLGLKGSSNAVVTPGGRKTEDSLNRKLSRKDELTYRANVAWANYMSQDRSDIQYQVKELSCHVVPNGSRLVDA